MSDGESTSGGPLGSEAAHVGPETPPTPADISVVNLRLPPFWPTDPDLWFAQVEAQFACKRITSQRSRFDHVVSSLSPEFAAEVRDLLLSPPARDPYSVLKTQLTKRTTLSEQRKLQQLFTGEELGDRKPTQLLRRMQQLLGDRPGLDTSFLRELFLQRLPSNVRMVLASSPEGTTLTQLAELADKVMEVASPSIAATSATSTTPISDPIAALTEELRQLRSDVSRLEKLVNKSSRSRPSRSNRPPSRSSTPPTPTEPDSDLCWYHHKYGDKAQRCRSPCTWSGNHEAGH